MATSKPTRVKPGIQSVERAFGILRTLTAAGGSLRLADIAEQAGLTRNLAHAYLVSLQRVGAVVQDEDTGRYDLGAGAVEIGLAALGRMDLMAHARTVMKALCSEVSESVWLSVWTPRGPVVVAKVDGAHVSPFEIRVGSIVDITVTATGLSFIAHIPRAQWQTIAKAERARMRALVPDDATLSARLEDVRSRGIANRADIVVPQQNTVLHGFSALAAPIFDHTGAIKAVLTVIGLTSLFDASLTGRNAIALQSAVRDLSAALGYRAAAASTSRSTAA
jgi:DNA-binding IclR family transcriptional regulator